MELTIMPPKENELDRSDDYRQDVLLYTEFETVSPATLRFGK